MTEPESHAADGLERSLGLFDLTCVVMSAIIGVGIFFQPARVAWLTGSVGLALAAWLIGGAIALAGALTFAELGAMFPRTGGQYVVLRESYGRAVAFLYGWALLSVIQSGAVAIIGIICVQNLARAAGTALGGGTEAGLAALLIAGLALVNALGVRQGARVTNTTMVLKAATLLAIAALALDAAPHATAGVTSTAAPSAPGSDLLRLAAALIPVLFVAVAVAGVTTATANATSATHQNRPSVGSSESDD
jgi:APA family basic amino acid/polyamine antiporter